MKARVRKDEHPFEDLMPDGVLQQMAWCGALHFAVSNQEVVDAYYQDTKDGYHVPASAINRMVDEACGADSAFLRRFVVWFNENVWGTEEAPVNE